jgi:small redox-active disulfide protein 2
MKIEILGPGCKRCDQLYENARAAILQSGSGGAITIEKIQDIMQITAKGVFMTPGMMIDGEVISVGKVLSVEQIVHIIEEKL